MIEQMAPREASWSGLVSFFVCRSGERQRSSKVLSALDCRHRCQALPATDIIPLPAKFSFVEAQLPFGELLDLWFPPEPYTITLVPLSEGDAQARLISHQIEPEIKPGVCGSNRTRLFISPESLVFCLHLLVKPCQFFRLGFTCEPERYLN